jgi:hypothetical protein
MQEHIVSISDIHKTLIPIFGDGLVRIVIEGNEAIITPKKAKRVLKSAGALQAYANPEMIAGEEKALRKIKEEIYLARYLRSHKPKISKKEERQQARIRMEKNVQNCDS